jgi:phenylacetate-CoA ligase
MKETTPDSPNFNRSREAGSRRKHYAEKAYHHLPVWAQNLAVSLYGLSYRRERLGGVFCKYVEEFRARDRWPKQRMQDFLEQQLRAVMLRAFREVPYYSQKWKSAGLNSTDLGRMKLSELPKLPVTPKGDLVGRAHFFVAQDIAAKKKLHRYYSSGSTGTPVTSIVSSEDHQRFYAAREVRSFGWAGTSLRWPRSMIGGRIVVPNPHSKAPYYRYNLAERQIYFSAFHISPDRVSDYVEGFHKYMPRVLTGYAHSHYTLARMMLETGQRLEYSPAALVLGSEKLTPEMKTVIQDAFRARPYEEYGAVEQCALATECEFGSLHVSPDFGIIEILDEQDMPVPDGKPGRIVCTGLLSETQPLIRYDIGDVGMLSAANCACGRDQLPVLCEITGRLEDVIVGRDGRQIVRFHGLFIDLPHVLEGQVIQETLDLIRVRVVTRPGFEQREEQLIHQRLSERLGAIRVAVERVNRIERTPRGKFRAVISNVSLNAARAIDVTSGSRTRRLPKVPHDNDATVN